MFDLSNDKGVNLLTAHGSKGLEFEYIFFTGVNASSWEKNASPAVVINSDTMFLLNLFHQTENYAVYFM